MFTLQILRSSYAYGCADNDDNLCFVLNNIRFTFATAAATAATGATNKTDNSDVSRVNHIQRTAHEQLATIGACGHVHAGLIH